MCMVSTQGIEVVLEERERTGGEDRRGKRVEGEGTGEGEEKEGEESVLTNA